MTADADKIDCFQNEYCYLSENLSKFSSQNVNSKIISEIVVNILKVFLGGNHTYQWMVPTDRVHLKYGDWPFR